MTTGLNTIQRRTFLKQAGLAGTALVLGVYASACTPTEPEGEIRAFRPGIDDIPEGTALGAFVIIDADNSVTIMSHRPDMGQGTFFSVPLIIAEELGVDPSAITIKKAPGDEKYGPQGVGGSASIRSMWEPMRKVGATARQLLLEAQITSLKSRQKSICQILIYQAFAFMKKLVSGILLSYLILLLACKDVILYLQLEANRDFIAEVLCINKDKPMVMCYGSCYINKTIRDNQDKEEHTPNPINQKKIEYIDQRIIITPLAFTTTPAEKKPLNAYHKNLLGKLFTHDIFHPPRQC